MKAIIFGITGQDGYYLNEILNNNKIEVIGVSRFVKTWLVGDIGDKIFVNNLIKFHKPEYIFHLAAISTTQHKEIYENHNAISTATINILEAVKNYSPTTKVFLSGSAMQFKNDGIPINENTPFDSSSFYSVARIHSVYAARYYRDRFGINVYVGYLFNHDSPFRTENHVNKKVVLSVKRIADGSKERLELGNLNVLKEFNFAGDIVKAIWQLVNQNIVYEAVIGSGIVYSIKEWTNACFLKYHLNWENFVDIKSDFIPEYLYLGSDPALIKSIGWKTEVNFIQLVDLMMD